MKNILKSMVFCLTAFMAVACGDLYETHEKYLKMGEETYIGHADTLYVNGGFNRIELVWRLNADPRISMCEISWNGCEQPLEVAADRTKDFMSKIIELPEGKYIFKVVIKSETGKESLPQTASGEVYGPTYQSRLPQRGINSMVATPAGVTLNWAPEEGCIGTHLTYTNGEGTQKTLFVTENEASTFIEDFVPGTDFIVSSLFKPEKNALDNMESLEKTFSFPSYYTVSKADWEAIYHTRYTDVDRTGWTVEANTEEAGGEGPVNGYVTALLDGDLSTFWHSKWNDNAKPPLPHLITIDMQEAQKIISIELARRKDNKDTKTVVFSISDDKENWTELGLLDFPNDPVPNAQILLLPETVSGRYIRASVTASNNAPHASIAEILFTTAKEE